MSGNYPPGTRAPRPTTIEMGCDECGEEWEVPAIMDLGTYTLENPDDDVCPNCGEVCTT